MQVLVAVRGKRHSCGPGSAHTRNTPSLCGHPGKILSVPPPSGRHPCRSYAIEGGLRLVEPRPSRPLDLASALCRHWSVAVLQENACPPAQPLQAWQCRRPHRSLPTQQPSFHPKLANSKLPTVWFVVKGHNISQHRSHLKSWLQHHLSSCNDQ